MLHYLGGLLAVLCLMVDGYLVWLIAAKDEQIATLRYSLIWESAQLRHAKADLRNLPMGLPAEADGHCKEFDTGHHFRLWHAQHVEIRGHDFKCPLHVRDDGAIEIETNGKVLIVIHKIRDDALGKKEK